MSAVRLWLRHVWIVQYLYIWLRLRNPFPVNHLRIIVTLAPSSLVEVRSAYLDVLLVYVVRA